MLRGFFLLVLLLFFLNNGLHFRIQITHDLKVLLEVIHVNMKNMFQTLVRKSRLKVVLCKQLPTDNQRLLELWFSKSLNVKNLELKRCIIDIQYGKKIVIPKVDLFSQNYISSVSSKTDL